MEEKRASFLESLLHLFDVLRALGDGLADREHVLQFQFAELMHVGGQVLDAADVHHVVGLLRHVDHHLQGAAYGSRLVAHALGGFENLSQEQLVAHDALHGLDQQIGHEQFLAELLANFLNEMRRFVDAQIESLGENSESAERLIR